MAELSNVTTVAIEPSADSLDQRRLKPQPNPRPPVRVRKEPEPAEEINESAGNAEGGHTLDVKA